MVKHFLLFFFFYSSAWANDYIKFDVQHKNIYQQIIQLDLGNAQSRLNQMSNENFARLLLEDYIDFFQLFIYERDSDYNRLEKNRKKRLNLIESSKLKEEWKLFLYSEIQLHWSLIYLKWEKNFLAFNCVREAYRKLENCQATYPDFIYSKKSLGILHTLLSTIPEELEWTSNLFGLNGDLKNGKEELKQFIHYAITDQDIFLSEAEAAYCFIISYIDNNPQEAENYWIKRMKKNTYSPLETMIETKLRIKAGHCREALRLLNLKSIDQKNHLPYLYFLSGLLKLQFLDYEAESDFINYLRLCGGKNYVKETYQKLSWISYFKGMEDKYNYYLNQVKKMGVSITDEDQQALKEAEYGQKPDVILLKSRLLCDGQSYQRAYRLLFKHLEEYYASPLKIEAAYRMGRICQLNGEKTQAISFYRDAIESQNFNPGYSHLKGFSALNIGIIKEEIGEKSEACHYYQFALDVKPSQYKRSLHQKAKAGQMRLNCIN